MTEAERKLLRAVAAMLAGHIIGSSSTTAGKEAADRLLDLLREVDQV